MSLIDFYRKKSPNKLGIYIETYWQTLSKRALNTNTLLSLFPGRGHNDVQYPLTDEFIKALRFDQELLENVYHSFMLACNYLGFYATSNFKLVKGAPHSPMTMKKMIDIWFITTFLYEIEMRGHAYALLLAVCNDMKTSVQLKEFITTDAVILFNSILKDVNVKI